MFEIKTKILAESAQIAQEAARAVMNGELEPRWANAAISGCRAMQGAVRADVLARLAGPKIAFLEERLAKAKSEGASGEVTPEKGGGAR